MKKWLKRVTPTPKSIHENRYLGIFGKLLHDPNLWHLNRRSVSGAAAAGLFVMYMPPVGHIVMSAALAIYLRVNLPIAVALVWISNPLTMPPMYYFAYHVGCRILGEDTAGFHMSAWLDWHQWIQVIWPLMLGCLVCGTVCGALGYAAAQGIWRWMLIRQIRRRRQRYRDMAASRLNTPSSSRQV